MATDRWDTKGPRLGPFGLWCSGRLIVDFAVVLIGAGVRVLLAAEFEQLDAVVRADLVSEVVEEFEHREACSGVQ